MKNFVKRMRAFMEHDPVRAREEAYLNEAASTADLEYRHREIDRGRFRNSARWGI